MADQATHPSQQGKDCLGRMSTSREMIDNTERPSLKPPPGFRPCSSGRSPQNGGGSHHFAQRDRDVEGRPPGRRIDPMQRSYKPVIPEHGGRFPGRRAAPPGIRPFDKRRAGKQFRTQLIWWPSPPRRRGFDRRLFSRFPGRGDLRGTPPHPPKKEADVAPITDRRGGYSLFPPPPASSPNSYDCAHFGLPRLLSSDPENAEILRLIRGGN